MTRRDAALRDRGRGRGWSRSGRLWCNRSRLRFRGGIHHCYSRLQRDLEVPHWGKIVHSRRVRRRRFGHCGVGVNLVQFLSRVHLPAAEV